MSTKHTPGPWTVTAMTGFCHHVSPQANSPEAHLANTRLIAAAPEMLATMRWLIEAIHRTQHNGTLKYCLAEICLVAKDMIARAEGRK